MAIRRKAKKGSKKAKMVKKAKKVHPSKVLGVSIPSIFAQKLHIFLLENRLTHAGLRPEQEKGVVIFPVVKLTVGQKNLISEKFQKIKFVSRSFRKRNEKPKTLEEALKGKLGEKYSKIIPTSFDTLGDCAILELEDEIVPKAKIIGDALMRVNPSVKSVFLKTGAHSGVFRSEPVKFIVGEKKEFATYREHGATFKISLGKVFFSPRLSTERIRIAQLIKPGEKVAALFAGVGPFPIIFAKNSKMQSAAAIELNPQAVENMHENVKINGVENKVFPVLGDVKALADSAQYSGQFDRAVMPLPKGGEDFLQDAIKYIKLSGGVVHYYQFVLRENPFEVPHAQIELACRALGRKFEVIFERKVRDYAKDIVQVVIDFRVWK